MSQFITNLWGKDEIKTNQFDNIEVYEIENEEGIYNFIDERWIETNRQESKRLDSSEDTRV